MVGREREREELASVLAGARDGRGRAVLLLGEAGMGKSVLADWAAASAAAVGLRTVRGWCSAAGMPPLWVWERVLKSMGLTLPWQGWRAGAARPDRELVAAAVVESLADAARPAPLLIVLEDVHWCDPASLLVARAVADAASALPLMLLMTCRDDRQEMAPQVRDQLADLPTAVRRMSLPPLGVQDVAGLAALSLGQELPEEEARELHARAGGNPFFVQELTRLMAAHGPAAARVVPVGIREVLERRIARLSQPCARLLTAASVAAQTAADLIETDLACEVCDLDPADAVPLLDEAVAARLVDFDPAAVARYRFRHALVREVMEQGLPGSERGRLHMRVAEALGSGEGGPSLAPRLAYHWSRATGTEAPERAAAWSLRAAREAMAGFGFEAAAAHYARAIVGPSIDRIMVSVEYGEALQLCGDVHAARGVLLATAAEAAAAGRPVDLANAALALGGGLAGFEVPIRDDDQSDLLRQADAILPPGESALRAAVRGRLSLALAGSAPDAERVRLAQDAVRMARAAGEARVESAVLAAYCDAIPGPDYVAERAVAAARMVSLAGDDPGSSLRQPASLLLARRLLVVAHLERGDLAGAGEQAAAYERLARRAGIPRYSWLPEIWRGMRALLDGNPGLALQYAAAAEQIGRRARSLNADLMVFTVRMQAHLDRGTPEQYAGDINGMLDRLGMANFPAMYLAAPGRALLAAGDAGHARTALRAFLTGPAEAMPRDAEWLESHWALADIALHLDSRPAVAKLFDALRPHESLWAVDGLGAVVFGTIAEQLGRLAAYLGRADEAGRYLATARERYVRAGAPALRDRVGALSPEPPQHAAGPGRLRRDGPVWVIEWHGRRSTVPDSKGMRDLAVLLSRPGQALPAFDLVEAAGGPPAAAAAAQSDLGPVLDDTARRAYRDRLAELDGELAEAEADADLGRLELLRAERSVLVDELAGAFGLGGRVRVAGDPAERARKAVTMRIRAGVKTIGRQDEALAQHLANAVRTGRLCSYEPEPGVSWQVSWQS